MTYTSVPTFTAEIFVGFKRHYDGDVLDRQEAKLAIKKYVDVVGLCVCVKDVEFIYSNGDEIGFSVGLINYPRFPSSPEIIKSKAITLGELLLRTCRQWKVSIVMPTETVMLSADD